MHTQRTIAVAAMVLAGAVAVQAQVTSSTRIPVRKDASTAAGVYVPDSAKTDTMSTRLPADSLSEPMEWYAPTGTTCSTVDVEAARGMEIKTDLYDSTTMISPDSAKIVALCAVPGQIGSGEMDLVNGRTQYAIDIIPNEKKTHTKVVVDAQTGAVLSSKQFGGLRGLSGWVRESFEHKQNKKPDSPR